MNEPKYEWQTLHTTKSNALEALLESKTALETNLDMPDVPGNSEHQSENLLNKTLKKKELTEITRAKLHVSTLPDGDVVDLVPHENNGLYPDEKSNPLDPVGILTANLKGMPTPSALGHSAKAEHKKIESAMVDAAFIDAIWKVGGQLKLLKSSNEGTLGKFTQKQQINIRKELQIFDPKGGKCKSGFMGFNGPKGILKLFCLSAKGIHYLVGVRVPGKRPESDAANAKVAKDLFKVGALFLAMRDKMTRDPKLQGEAGELMDMTNDEIDLELQALKTLLPNVPKGGKGMTRKHKKRRVNKHKTRKGRKSRRHKSKTHKKLKRGNGHKSRKY